MPTPPTSPTPPAALAAAWQRFDAAWEQCRTANGSILIYAVALDAMEYLLASRRACVEAGWREVWLSSETMAEYRICTLLERPSKSLVELLARDLALGVDS